MRKQFYLKKTLVLLSVVVLALCSTQTNAQVTGSGIFFQAVARDGFSNPAKDRNIVVETSLIQTVANGTVILTERFNATTDASGVFNVSIGEGTRIGGSATNFKGIDWSKGPFFLNVKIAIAPIVNPSSWDYTKDLVDLGTSPFGAVPYALFAASVAGFDTKVNVADTAKMLSAYAKVANLNSLVTNKVNIADSITQYVTPTQLAAKTFDQTPLLNSIATKLNIADSISKYVTPAQLAAKTFDSTAIYNQLALKATTTTVNASLATKLNIADSISKYVTSTQLALKANTADVNTALGLKANTADVNTALGLKANTADVNTSLGLKANTTDVNTALALKANTSDVNTALSLKANDAAVTTALGTKENTTNKSLDVSLDGASDVKFPSVKAIKTYVDASIVANTTPLTFNAPLSKSGFTVSIPQANGSNNGYLNSSDWTSFNNKIDATQKAAINGVATLGNDGKIPSNQIPAISFQSATVVTSQANMLALSGAVVGSIAIRTDNNKNYVLSAAPASTLANWIELATPNSVTSVNGFAGPNVTITTNDVSEGANNKYYTDARVRGALSATAPLTFNSSTGAFSIPQASTTADGFLSATDWNTFKNKQNALVAGTDYVTPSGNITGNAGNVTGVVSVVNGGTGSSTAVGALANLGAEPTANKSNDVAADAASTTKFPSVKAIKDYVDLQSANAGVADNSITSAKISGTIAIGKGGTGATTAAAARTNLGLVIGTDVMAATATTTLTGDVTGSGNGSFATTVNSVGGITAATIAGLPTSVNANTASITSNTNSIAALNTNVSANTASITSNTNSIATLNTNVAANTASITAETTRATNAENALDIRVSSNTTSITTNTADILLRAPLASPVFTGTPTAPTPATNDNSTTLATTAYVKNSITAANAGLSSIGAISATSNAKGATISGTTELILTPADATNGGVVTTGTQTFAGSKTFSNTATFNTDITVNGLTVGRGNFSNNSNTALGSLALYLNTSGSGNTAIGQQALNKVVNTNYNTAIGRYSSYYTIGSYNTAIGNQALYGASGLSTGSSNTAIGASSMFAATTASNNVSIGVSALTNNTTGNNNVALGYDIGTQYGTGSGALLTKVDQAVLIGSYVRTGTNTSINETVIGYNAIGNGSNTVTIGNNSITANYFKGDINLTGNVNGGTWSGTTIGSNYGGAGTVNGLMKADGTGVVSAAVAGTDYQSPLTAGSGISIIAGTISATGLTTSNLASNAAITNAQLANSATTLGSTTMTLGGNVTSVTGLTSLAATNLTGALTGNASTATALATGRTISTTGDVTYTSGSFDGSGDVTGVATLAASGVSSGTYGSSTAIPVLTVDTKGRVTSASTVGIIAGVNSLNYTSTTSYASGGIISGTSLTLAAADATNPGLVSTGAQTIAGAKTFNNDLVINGLSVGRGAGQVSSNAAFGATALNANTTGNYNVAIGSEALKSNTNGSVNVALGAATIDNLTSGNNNTVIGSFAGRNYGPNGGSTGNNTTMNNGILLGYDARPLVSGGTDEVVIGMRAIGHGSNTVTLGNSSNTKTYLTGDLSLTGNIISGTWSATEIAIAKGGTGATTAIGALSNLGAQSVANMSTNITTDAASTSKYPSVKLIKDYVDAQTASAGVSDGSITNVKLANSTTTLGTTTMTLGGTVTSVTGLTSLTATNLSGTLSGTSTALATGRTISTTGDVTYTSGSFDGSANVTGTATLTNTTVTAGTYGSSTAIPTITVDSKGRLTAASTVSIIAGVNTLTYTTGTSYTNGGTISGTTLTLAAADASNPGLISTGTQTIAGAKTFSSDVTAPNFLGNATTATTAGNITATSNTTLTSLANLTTVGTITSGTWSGSVIGATYGGTGLTSPGTSGNILTSNGITWVSSAPTGVNTLTYTSATSYSTGGTISGTTLTLAAASSTNPGLVSTGTQTFVGSKTFSPTVSASGAIARGVNFTPSLTATASDDVLVGIDINPTFSNGSYLRVANYGIRVQNIGIGTGGGNINTNTTIGNAALYKNTSGNQNTAFGYWSLMDNSTGSQNTSIGSWALKNNTTGTDNTAIGFQAMQGSGSRNYNTAIGSLSQGGSSGTFTNTSNTSVGYNSLNAVTSGSENVAIGKSALYGLTTANYNTALGSGAGGVVVSGSTVKTTGDYGIYIGYNALALANNTSNEIVIGSGTSAGGYNIGNGSNTVTIGNSATTANYFRGVTNLSAGTMTNTTGVDLTGSINDFFQFNVKNSSTGSQAQSGYSATADNGTNTSGFAWMGINNSTFNYPTAYNIGAANDVTYVGSGQDMHIANANNTKSIIFSTGIATTPYFSEKMRITATGNVGIGTNSPTANLEVTGTTKLVGAATFSSTVSIPTGAAAGKVLTSDASGGATWQNSGGSVVTMSATGTATSTATYIIFTGSTASQTITIPSAVTLGAGRELTIKNVASVSVSIASAGGYLIQDNSTLTSASAALGIEPSNNWMKLVSDGTNWYIFRALF